METFGTYASLDLKSDQLLVLHLSLFPQREGREQFWNADQRRAAPASQPRPTT